MSLISKIKGGPEKCYGRLVNEVSSIYCLDILINIEYCLSERYGVYKKSQCATGSNSDQPVIIRLAKSASSRYFLVRQCFLVGPDKAHAYNEKIVGMQADLSL